MYIYQTISINRGVTDGECVNLNKYEWDCIYQSNYSMYSVLSHLSFPPDTKASLFCLAVGLSRTTQPDCFF